MRMVPNWDRYFINIANVIAERSKDPNTQVGTVIIDSDKHIIGTGYNGFAPNINETSKMWERPFKYERVIHSEVNAIAHSTASVKGGTLYTTHYPCQECCKVIIAAGIKKIVTTKNNSHYNDKSFELLTEAKVDICEI